MVSKEHVTQFQNELLTWYAENRRVFPWRETCDPYAILVSEIMSQQTQINRVVEKYDQWMEVFPSMGSLAKAETKLVLQYWSGLGYNRRALYLQTCAKTIVTKYNGIFPCTYEKLIQLPGLGDYTVSAILCFAFDQQIPVIDTNVRKVIAVEFCGGKLPSKKEIREIAFQLLPKGNAYTWNQALMDYAALVLKGERIAIPKQSKFKGSHRYYRGRILKQLLQGVVYEKRDLYANFSHELSLETFNMILDRLEKDNLIMKDGDKLLI